MIWVSADDMMFRLFNTDIEPPIVVHDLLITSYSKTPLYNNLFKYEIQYSGNPEVFKSFLTPIPIIQFPLPTVTETEFFWLKRLLHCILYKKGYPVDRIDVDHAFYPMNNMEYMYGEPIDIDVHHLIGYKPLIDLYALDVSLEMATSDFIWAADLPEVINLYDIPVIKINGDVDQKFKATLHEFAINIISPIASTIVKLSQDSFIIDKNEKNHLITQFNFKEIPIALPDRVILQHELLDEAWYRRGKAEYSFYGPWMWLNPVPANIHQLQRIANKIKKSVIEPDLKITMPVSSYEEIKKINIKLNQLFNKVN